MRSHFVVVSPSSGGAEKRFFDVFTALRRGGADAVLIAPSSLVDQLKADHQDRLDIADALVPVTMARWSRIGFVLGFRRLLRNLPKGASFHYPLNCLWPLHVGRGDRVTMTVADCTSVPAPFSPKRTSVWAWISFFFVAGIDVLSPAIFSAMRGYRTAGKMQLTPGGTFLVPPPVRNARRRPTVVFLGRLVPGKGIDELLDRLPSLWASLRDRVPADFAFEVAGYGPLETEVARRATSLDKAGIPVSFIGYAVADALLGESMILLSLQQTTNYPSRVVAEALMSGCTVVIRDTGDSREFGTDLPGLVYCGAGLDPQELAERILVLLQRIAKEEGFLDGVRSAAIARFGSDRYLDYFRDLTGNTPP